MFLDLSLQKDVPYHRVIYAQSVAYAVYLAEHIWVTQPNLFLSNLSGIENPSIVNWQVGKLESILVSVSTKISIFLWTRSFNYFSKKFYLNDLWVVCWYFQFFMVSEVSQESFYSLLWLCYYVQNQDYYKPFFRVITLLTFIKNSCTRV